MNNKVLVNLSVPELDEKFDLYLPANKKIGNILVLINKTLNELSDGKYPIKEVIGLFNLDTKELYTPDTLLVSTTIRNGSKLMIISK